MTSMFEQATRDQQNLNTWDTRIKRETRSLLFGKEFDEEQIAELTDEGNEHDGQCTECGCLCVFCDCDLDQGCADCDCGSFDDDNTGDKIGARNLDPNPHYPGRDYFESF